MDNKQFIERVYELAFGHDAINRNFGHAEVIEQLEEFNEDSLKWDSIPDDEKEEYENDFYEVPDKEDLAEWTVQNYTNGYLITIALGNLNQ